VFDDCVRLDGFLNKTNILGNKNDVFYNGSIDMMCVYLLELPYRVC
jgi:hypothetical protein